MMHIIEVGETERKTAQREYEGLVVQLTPNFYAIYLLWSFDVSRMAGWEVATDEQMGMKAAEVEDRRRTRGMRIQVGKTTVTKN